MLWSLVCGLYSSVKHVSFSGAKWFVIKIFLILLDLEGIMLIEISQTEKDKHDLSYMWNLKNPAHRNRTDMWLPEVGGQERGKWVKLGKRYKASSYKSSYKSSSMMTGVENTALYI